MTDRFSGSDLHSFCGQAALIFATEQVRAQPVPGTVSFPDRLVLERCYFGGVLKRTKCRFRLDLAYHLSLFLFRLYYYPLFLLRTYPCFPLISDAFLVHTVCEGSSVPPLCARATHTAISLRTH